MNEKLHPIAIQARLVADVKRPTVLDIGARGGDPTTKYLRSIPNCRLMAVDADPEAYDALKTMYAKDGRVRVVQAALTDHNGTAELYMHGGGTNSLYPRPYSGPVYYPPKRRATRTIEVPAMTVDGLMGDEPVHLLKMDIQGGELGALRGAIETLQNVRSVYTEVMFAPHYEGQPLYHHIAAFMEEQGFYLHALYFLSNNKNDGRLRQGDALFIRERGG